MCSGNALLYDSHGVKRLYMAMDRRRDVVNVQAAACRALANFTAEARFAEFVWATEGLSRLLHALEGNRNDDRVTVPACQALHNISRVPGSADVIVGRGLATLVSVMIAQQFQPSVQASASGVVRELATQGEGRHRVKVASSGAVGVMVTALGRWVEDAAVQQSCCEALAAVASHPQCVQSLVDEGAIHVVVATLARPTLAHRPDILSPALDMLSGMCVTLPNVLAAVRGGVLPHVIAAMDSNGDSCDVVTSAMHALAQLCDCERHRVAVCDAGGLAHTLAGMAAHIDAVPAQLAGCRALAAMGRAATVASRIVQSTGLQRLQCALTRHIRNKEVCEAVVTTLATLAQTGGGLVTAILAGDGVDTLFMAMDRWTDSVCAQVQGCEFVCAVARMRDGRASMLARGAPGRIHALMRLHEGNEEVLEAARQALMALHPRVCAARPAHCGIS